MEFNKTLIYKHIDLTENKVLDYDTYYINNDIEKAVANHVIENFNDFKDFIKETTGPDTMFKEWTSQCFEYTTILDCDKVHRFLAYIMWLL